jgi:large subunit ribosomal protein L35
VISIALGCSKDIANMPKQKTHKGIAKRFKVTGRGKVKYRRPGNSHLSSHKPGARVRHLRKHAIVPTTVADKIIQAVRPIL